MCYARRQRSSWARIKLSIKKFYLSLFYYFTVLLGIVETGADTYFYVSFLVLLLVLSYLKFLCTISSLFNFQGSIRASPQDFSLGERLIIIALLFLFVNTFFEDFIHL